MEKLNKLKKQIEEKERMIREAELKEKKHKELVETISRLQEEIKKTNKEEYKVRVENQKEFPADFKVNNLEDIKFPKNIKVDNLDEIKIPKFPSEIEVKKPSWFSLQKLFDEVKTLKNVIERTLKLDKFKKKENAIAVRLVTKDGYSYYNAGGGSGGMAGTSDLAKESKQDDIITELQKLVGFEIPEYDYIALTYVSAGNGAGEIETVVYKQNGAGGTTVATLTLTYNASNEIATITKT